MKEYCVEYTQMAEAELELTELGFTKKMTELGELLKSAKTVEEIEKVINTIKLYKKAVDGAKNRFEYAKDKYEEEIGETYQKTKTRELLFGEKK